MSIHLIIYTGLDLNEEATILKAFDSKEKAEEWFKAFALDRNTSEEILDEEFEIKIYSFDHVKDDPYVFGPWEQTSLWSIVNHDFSKMTMGRWKTLEKQLDLPPTTK